MSSAVNALSNAISVRTFNGTKGLSALREDWERLTRLLPVPRFFHFYGWYKCWLEALVTDPASAYFFALYNERSIVGIVPLQLITRSMSGLPLRRLELPRHDHMNLADVVFAPDADHTALMLSLIRHLEQHTNKIPWDLLSFSRTQESSAVTLALRATLRLRCESVKHGHNPYVLCPDSAASDRLPPSFRRNLRRLARRSQGELKLVCYREKAELPKALATFFEIEASGWKGRNGDRTAIACNPSLQAFYQSLAEYFAEIEGCIINLLWLNNVCIAGQLGLLTERVLYILKIGYSDAHRHLAPGNLLMQRALEHYGAANNVDAVSFVSEVPWEHRWRTQAEPLWDHKIFNRTFLGHVGHLRSSLLRLLPGIRSVKRRTSIGES